MSAIEALSETLSETVALSTRLLYRTGLATTRGHTSARIEGTETFIIKPWPHIQMHRVEAADLIVMDFDGNIVGSSGKITRVSEWPIHAEIYRAFPDVGSIVHTHQRWATMLGIAGRTILPVVGPELAAPVAEAVPVLDEDKSLIRSVEQGKLVARRMKGASALHLQNHGMVFAAPNVEIATLDALQTEYQAEMTWRALLIGEPGTIPPLDLRSSVASRAAGVVPEAWERYWKWVDRHPEALHRRTADI